MAGMEGLGRVFNVISVASGVGINLSGASAVSFIGTNDNTYTVTIAKTFAGSYTQPTGFNPIARWYQDTSNGAGTAAWTKQTQAASNALVIASDYQVVFTVLASQMPDLYQYVKCTASSPGDGTLVAVLHDLTVQRGPANLAILSA